MSTKTDIAFDLNGFSRIVNQGLFDIYVRRLVREQIFTYLDSPDHSLAECLAEENKLICEAEIALKEHLSQFISKVPGIHRSVDLTMKLLIERHVFDLDMIEDDAKLHILSRLLDCDFSLLVPERMSQHPKATYRDRRLSSIPG